MFEFTWGDEEDIEGDETLTVMQKHDELVVSFQREMRKKFYKLVYEQHMEKKKQKLSCCEVQRGFFVFCN